MDQLPISLIKIFNSTVFYTVANDPRKLAFFIAPFPQVAPVEVEIFATSGLRDKIPNRSNLIK